jgi:hypothetical protein
LFFISGPPKVAVPVSTLVSGRAAPAGGAPQVEAMPVHPKKNGYALNGLRRNR